MSEARSVVDALVEHELEARRMPQCEPPPELTAQEAGGTRKARVHLLGRMKRCEGDEEHPRASHVRSDAHRGDGDVAHPRILDLARDQRREHALDLGLDALAASVRGHCSVLATSTRAKHSI